MSASDDGTTAALPIAASARNPMSTPTEGANPHASDANVETAKPTSHVRRRPTRSAALPNAGTKIDRNRNGADTTQVIAASEVWKSRRMNGTAVVSAVTVSPLANNPAHTVPRTHHRYGIRVALARPRRGRGHHAAPSSSPSTTSVGIDGSRASWSNPDSKSGSVRWVTSSPSSRAGSGAHRMRLIFEPFLTCVPPTGTVARTRLPGP